MANDLFSFLSRHSSLIITTHHSADPDGIGAEIVLSQIANSMGKQIRIINPDPVSEKFKFLDPENTIESWKNIETPGEAALVILDTADEYNIGDLREYIHHASEVYVIDHHEPSAFNTFKGYIDPTASSTSEMMVELAEEAGIKLKPESARAAYAGIVYDSGFFAYPKTTSRTYKAALTLMEAGISPNEIYRRLSENTSVNALKLQQAVLSTLEIHDKVAVQKLRKKDLEDTGALYEDAENFINGPMKCRDIEVSIVVKENREGQIRCSLRSKGNVNVAKIAQSLGGGGHVTAAGFKSSLTLDETVAMTLEKINEKLENT